MGSSKLLIQESPMQFQPGLAKLLGGADKAIVLQQVHYWVERSGKEFGGQKWIWNSISEWNKQFNWLSEKTVKRIFNFLVEQNFLITGNFNKQRFDRTKWYTINYKRLNEAMGQFDPIEDTKRDNRKGQFDPIEEDKLTSSDGDNLTLSEGDNLTRPIPLDYQENNHKTSSINKAQENEPLIDPMLASKMLAAYNKATGRNNENTGTFSSLAMKNVSLEDFQDVLNYMVTRYSDIEYITVQSLVNKFEKHLDSAKERGFVDGKIPEKKVNPKLGEKQEPPMAKNEVPASKEKVDMQSVKDMLKGYKTHD